jgi:P-type Ca2+ transporter type 2C
MVNETRDSFTSSELVAPPHTLAPEEVAAHLEVRPNVGLTGAQVKRRQVQYGPNRLPEAPPRSAWRVFFGQFKSILILILIGAALLAALIGNVKDAVIIIAVVVINAVVGFSQEYRAEQSLAALKDMLPVKTRVRRAGGTQEIAAEELVPGDVVLLEAGDRVPADGRLSIAAGLEIDESTLTGESQPVGKHIAALAIPVAPLGDRINMAFMNTMLTRGRAELIVTATGVHPEMGRLSQELASATEAPTPLQMQLDRLGKRLGTIALTLVGLLSFLELLRGTDLVHIILDAIALAVAAMPEGLPVVVTVTLALGMHRMARQRAIVKRLASVETLGCTTVICSDKTGTLTLNQMTVRAFFYQGERFEVSGEGYRPHGSIRAVRDGSPLPDLTLLLIPLVACNDSCVDEGRVIGDPMEAALLILADKGGIVRHQVAQRLPRLAEVPFDSAHKFMATIHREDDRVHVFVKGAPDVLLARCDRWRAGGDDRPLDTDMRDRIDTAYTALAEGGLRGLLIASRTVPARAFDASAAPLTWVNGLTCIGLVGLMDPPRPEAKEAIAQCQQAGIAVKMITGDHQSTAAAIAKELGLTGRTISGEALDRMGSDQLAAVIDGIAVIARVSPAHKVKIVRALQAKGHVVAMTGDGVNDAPALKSADIGVAMGISGTAVAKEAATMVLTDDNFATIVSAVKQGRTLYDNILKFVRFQLSTTIGAILTVFFAPLAGLPEPFTPIQILWVAIIMDGPPAVSLALDTARPGIMREPPRSRAEPVLPFSRVTTIVTYGITMMVGTLGVLYYGLQTGTEQRALTLAFTTFVLFQCFNVFNARTEKGTAFNVHVFANAMLWVSLAGVIALQAIAVHWPRAQPIFGTGGMTLADWGIATGVAASVLLLEEGRKLGLAALGRFRRGAAPAGSLSRG